VVRKSFEKLLGSVGERAKEDSAQAPNVQSRGPFELELPNVVANDCAAILQKQVARLKIMKIIKMLICKKKFIARKFLKHSCMWLQFFDD
jgi:hypothetical protein